MVKGTKNFIPDPNDQEVQIKELIKKLQDSIKKEILFLPKHTYISKSGKKLIGEDINSFIEEYLEGASKVTQLKKLETIEVPQLINSKKNMDQKDPINEKKENYLEKGTGVFGGFFLGALFSNLIGLFLSDTSLEADKIIVLVCMGVVGTIFSIIGIFKS